MRLALVTGARGIGFEVGRALVRNGDRVIFGVRNAEAGARAADAIRAETPAADVGVEVLDLADLKSVTAFGERMRAAHPSLDVQVNNAGVVMPLARELTADGFELHFGTNHLGHFAMTAELLPLLRASSAPRVVVVGSLAHRFGRIDFTNLQAERKYHKTRAYAQSKLANLLFMAELQRRSDAAGWGLTVAGAHPGFARTEAIKRESDGPLTIRFQDAMSGLIPTAEHAARPIVLAATSPDVRPGDYFGPSGPLEIGGTPGPARLARPVRDTDLAARLWNVSETLSGAQFTA